MMHDVPTRITAPRVSGGAFMRQEKLIRLIYFEISGISGL
jgi:hypothetical protein